MRNIPLFLVEWKTAKVRENGGARGARRRDRTNKAKKGGDEKCSTTFSGIVKIETDGDTTTFDGMARIELKGRVEWCGEK